jgi:hypothetical protein
MCQHMAKTGLHLVLIASYLVMAIGLISYAKDNPSISCGMSRQ